MIHYTAKHGDCPLFLRPGRGYKGMVGGQKVSGSDRKQTIISFQSAGGMIYSTV